MSGQVSLGSAGEYQADEQAGVLQLLNFHSNSKDLKCFCYYIYFAIEFAMRTSEVLVLDLVYWISCVEAWKDMHGVILKKLTL